MPTISYVLNALNRMSGPFNEARQSVEKLAIAEKALATTQARLEESYAKLAAANEALAHGADVTGRAVEQAAAKVDVYQKAVTAAAAKVAAATGRMESAWQDVVHEMNMAMLASREMMDASDALTKALAGEDLAARSTADSMTKLAVSSGAAAVSQKAVKDQTAASALVAGRAYRGWFGLWGILGRKVNLFGGALQIGLLHLLVDVFAEILAVVIPAALGLTAWGIAASDAFRKVQIQLTNMHTVMDATGQEMHGFTGDLEKLHQAVQPEVFQLLGDAMLVVRSHAGEFAKVVMQVNDAIRGLATRMTIALTSGAGFGQFMSKAGEDVAKLGELLGNLGGALGAIIKQMPGVAEVLLNVLIVLSRVLEVAAQFAGALIKITLAGHGILIWVGLAVTALKGLWGWFTRLGMATVGWSQKQLVMQAAARASSKATDDSALSLLQWSRNTDTAGLSAERWNRLSKEQQTSALALRDANRAAGEAAGAAVVPMAALSDAEAALAGEGGAAAGSLGTIAVAEDGVAVAAGEATTAAGFLDGALAALGAVNPLVWVAAAVVALGFLIVKFHNTQTAAEQMIGNMQQALLKTPVTDFARQAAVDLSFYNKQISQTQVALAKLATANPALARNAGTPQFADPRTNRQLYDQVNAYQQLKTKAADYISASRKLIDQNALFTSRQRLLNNTVQQGAGSLGLLSAAGVTTQQMLTNNKDALAQIVVQVEATIQGYKMMGQTGSTLGNDLQALNRTATDQYQAMQKLNQAWDAFITDVTGTQNSLDSVVQGFQTLSSAGVKVHNSLGHASDTFAGLGKNMDGLSKKDVALNQAFTGQVTNLNTLFDSWRTAGVASNLFTKGVKAGIAPLVQYARGSKEGTAQLIALAQEAGYHGPESMKRLTEWLGKTGNATRILKQVSDQATVQEALLTTQLGKQGTYIANQLLGDLNDAIIKYSDIKGAVNAYAKAVAQQGAQSDAAHAARKRLIDDILQTGHNADWSRGKIAGLIAKVLNIPYKRALQIVMTGDGSYTVRQGKFIAGPKQSSGQRFGIGSSGHAFSGSAVPRAGGGFIRGPGTAVSDSIPAYLSNGEYVVKAAAVQKYGTHMMDAINTKRFAQGGMATLEGNKAVLSGEYAVSTYNSYANTFGQAMVKAMRASLKQAQQAAMAFLGGGVAANGPLQQFARKLLAAYGWGGQWAPFNSIVMAESGWNVHATNPSSGAYGIPQALPASKMASAGADWATNGYTQLRWMMAYIKQRYGSPAAAWAFHLANNAYASGTPGAAPGWAWVGEKGPELVRFAGGEQVLSHLDSLAAGTNPHGYVLGTEKEREAQSRNLLQRLADGETKASKVRDDEQLSLRIIARYFRGADRRKLEDTIRRQAATSQALLAEAKSLTPQLKAERAYAGSVTKNLRNYTPNLLGPGSGAGIESELRGRLSLITGFGGDIRSLSRENAPTRIIRAFTSAGPGGAAANIATYRKFGAAVKKLQNRGLHGELISEIINLGAVNGLKVADEILSGGPGLIRQLESTEKQIKRATGQVGRGAASSVYGGGYDAATGFLKGLQKQRAALYREATGWGDAMGHELARWLGIPRSKWPGSWHAGGMDAIVNRPTIIGVGEAGPERVTVTPQGKPMGRYAPLMYVENQYLREPADANRVAAQIDFKVRWGGSG